MFHQRSLTLHNRGISCTAIVLSYSSMIFSEKPKYAHFVPLKLNKRIMFQKLTFTQVTYIDPCYHLERVNLLKAILKIQTMI